MAIKGSSENQNQQLSDIIRELESMNVRAETTYSTVVRLSKSFEEKTLENERKLSAIRDTMERQKAKMSRYISDQHSNLTVAKTSGAQVSATSKLMDQSKIEIKEAATKEINEITETIKTNTPKLIEAARAAELSAASINELISASSKLMENQESIRKFYENIVNGNIDGSKTFLKNIGVSANPDVVQKLAPIIKEMLEDVSKKEQEADKKLKNDTNVDDIKSTIEENLGNIEDDGDKLTVKEMLEDVSKKEDKKEQEADKKLKKYLDGKFNDTIEELSVVVGSMRPMLTGMMSALAIMGAYQYVDTAVFGEHVENKLREAFATDRSQERYDQFQRAIDAILDPSKRKIAQAKFDEFKQEHKPHTVVTTDVLGGKFKTEHIQAGIPQFRTDFEKFGSVVETFGVKAIDPSMLLENIGLLYMGADITRRLAPHAVKAMKNPYVAAVVLMVLTIIANILCIRNMFQQLGQQASQDRNTVNNAIRALHKLVQDVKKAYKRCVDDPIISKDQFAMKFAWIFTKTVSDTCSMIADVLYAVDYTVMTGEGKNAKVNENSGVLPNLYRTDDISGSLIELQEGDFSFKFAYKTIKFYTSTNTMYYVPYTEKYVEVCNKFQTDVIENYVFKTYNDMTEGEGESKRLKQDLTLEQIGTIVSQTYHTAMDLTRNICRDFRNWVADQLKPNDAFLGWLVNPTPIDQEIAHGHVKNHLSRVSGASSYNMDSRIVDGGQDFMMDGNNIIVGEDLILSDDNLNQGARSDNRFSLNYGRGRRSDLQAEQRALYERLGIPYSSQDAFVDGDAMFMGVDPLEMEMATTSTWFKPSDGRTTPTAAEFFREMFNPTVGEGRTQIQSDFMAKDENGNIVYFTYEDLVRGLSGITITDDIKDIKDILQLLKDRGIQPHHTINVGRIFEDRTNQGTTDPVDRE